MTAKNDIFEGLHVLLVTEDDSRAQALAKALRDRKANVGDVKAGARDPVALRGADLIMVDARSAESTRVRLSDMRADVRARWASVVTLDYGKLVLDDGAIYLAALEEAILPQIAADKALAERARKEGVFETTLAPLGPSRTLRALAMAGPTLHVTLVQGDLSATVCLSNELLVCAFVERGTEHFEAWAALARVLGLSDARMTVEKRAHPTAMNIMEPINQALEVAAQERQSSVNLPAVDVLPVAAGMGKKGASDDMMDLPAVKPGAGPKRTLLGVPAPGPGAGRPVAKAGSSAQKDPSRPVQSTIRGMPPTTAPRTSAGTPGPVARPVAPANDVTAPEPESRPEPPPLQAEAPRAKAKSRPELEPVALDEGFVPRAKTVPDAPARTKSSSMLEPVGTGVSRSKSREQLRAVELPEDRPVPPREPFTEEATKPALQLADRLSAGDRMTLGDRPTDPTALAARTAEPIAVRVDIPKAPATPPEMPKPSAPQLDELMEMGTPVAPVEDLPTRPYEPANLMAAIAEEVPSQPPLADSAVLLVDPRIRKQIQEETLVIVRKEQRRSRAVMLFVLLLFAVGNFFALRYLNEQNQVRGTITRAAPGEEGAAEPSPTPRKPKPVAAAPVPAPVAAAPVPAAPVAAAPVAAAPVPSAAPTPAAPEPVAAAPAVAEPTTPVAAPSNPAALPTDSEGLLQAGLALLEAGKKAEARDVFERAVQSDPKSAHAYSGLADAQLALGDTSGALRSVEQAIRIRPKRARYRVQHGDVLKAQGKLEEARAAYDKALEIDPNDREAKRRVGP